MHTLTLADKTVRMFLTWWPFLSLIKVVLSHCCCRTTLLCYCVNIAPTHGGMHSTVLTVA